MMESKAKPLSVGMLQQIPRKAGGLEPRHSDEDEGKGIHVKDEGGRILVHKLLCVVRSEEQVLV